MTATTENEFLSVEELSRRYSVPVSTVYAWLHKGTAPASLKIGKHRRFRLSDVLAWEDDRTDDRTPDAAA